MKLTKGFWIVLIIMIILFALPTFLTYRAPTYDGIRTDGFPLRFNSEGGMCISPEGNGVDCGSFSLTYLIIDIMILIGLPILVNFIVLKFKK
jgi:hypothetical protein